ncbi:MAG: RsmE family RNA methyltransferase [Polyangiaceae bacterium]
MTTRRAPIDDLAGNRRVELDPSTSRYLGRVLRLAEGDSFVAFDPRSAVEADARIVATKRGALVVEIGDLRSADVVASRGITLVQALAKGDKCDAIVRDATELGATRIVFVATERSVVELTAKRAIERVARWERIAHEAARQSLRGDAPSIAISTWKDAMRASREDASFVLHPLANVSSSASLRSALSDPKRAVAFAVGPEGGLTVEEVETAEKQAWIAISLGPVILRTETVAMAVLGAARVLCPG